MSKKEKPFTTKDTDKLKKALQRAGAILIRGKDWIGFSQQDWDVLKNSGIII